MNPFESTNDKEDENLVEFNEFHIASNRGDFVDSASTFDSLQSYDIAFEELDLDAKYRSISTMSHANVQDFNLATRSAPLPKSSVFSVDSIKSKDVPKTSVPVPQIEVVPSNTSGTSSRPLTVPPEPFYISPSTHFLTKLNVGDVKARVEVELSSRSGVSFEFFSAKCRWEVVYLVGSSRCKLEINVFKRPSGGFLVEGNRISGDSFAFVSIYKAIHHAFDSSVELAVSHSLPVPSFDFDLDSNVVDKSIDDILAMATSGLGEAQVGASQIFCDIFSRDDTAHLMSKYTECISALIDLTQINFESCNQHAYCALANLSSTPSCQKELIQNESFLQSLLELCADGKYDTIEMRRECARLLANISGVEASAQQIVSCAGRSNIASWLSTVDDLKDERLRLHADRAKVSLASCT